MRFRGFEPLFVGLFFLFFTKAGLAHSSRRSQGSLGPQVLKMDWGVRGQGMGGAYVAMSDDPTSVFWNPAGLNRTQGAEGIAMSGRDADHQRQGALAFVFPVWQGGCRATWGVGATQWTMDSFDVYENEVRVGSARPSDAMASVAYARDLGFWSAGTTLKMVHERLYESRGTGWAVDVGGQGGILDDRLRWGAVINNVGPPVKMSGEEVSLPLLLRLGAGYSVWERGGPRGDGVVEIQVDVPADGEPIPRLGVEYAKDRPEERWGFRLRGGVRFPTGAERLDETSLSIGFGVRHSRLNLNYAFLPNTERGASQMMDVGYRFGGIPPEQVRRDEGWSEAMEAYRGRKFIRAREILDELLAVFPHDARGRALRREVNRRINESVDPETLYVQGRHAFAQGDYEQSVVFFRKLVLVRPDHQEGEAWLEKAEKEENRVKGEKLRADVDRVQRQELEAQTVLAKNYESRGKWTEALAAWRIVLTLDKANAKALVGRGRCRAALYEQAQRAESGGDREIALALYRKALDGEKEFLDAARSVERITGSLGESRRIRAQSKHAEGLEAYHRGDLAGARALFQEALALTPEDPVLLRSLDRVVNEMAVEAEKSKKKEPPR